MSGVGTNTAKILTAKQQCFVAEYLVDMNATQAALRAGYSTKTAHVIGHENLNKPEIAAAIAAALEARAEKTGIDAAWVLTEAKNTYLEARANNKLSDAVAALKLVGTHIDVQAFKERVAQEHSLSREAEKWLGR